MNEMKKKETPHEKFWRVGPDRVDYASGAGALCQSQPHVDPLNRSPARCRQSVTVAAAAVVLNLLLGPFKTRKEMRAHMAELQQRDVHDKEAVKVAVQWKP